MSTSTNWQLARDAADRYQRIAVQWILGHFAKALVDHANLQAGERVLDVGCGTGAVARYAAEPVGSSGQVVGVDINIGMIEVAKSITVPNNIPIQWHVDSAYKLPCADSDFDAVLCAQTFQFLDQPEIALAEMRRVLKESGRLSVSVWCSSDQNPYFGAVVDAVTQHLGADAGSGLRAGFRLSDPDMIRSLFAEAGFRNIDIHVIRLDLLVPPLQDFIPRHISATPMSAAYNAAPQDTQAKIIQDVSSSLNSYVTSDGARIPFHSYLAQATR
jgi:ubiquinone/menaquinone biosynthesis C-methylase UbiE